MRYELKKNMSRGILLLLLICIAVNGYLFYNRISGMYGGLRQEYPAYEQMLDALNQDLDTDLTAMALDKNSYALYEASVQQEYLQMYPQYIKEMPERARAASILTRAGDKSGFSRRNIDKTVADFAGLDALPVRAGLNAAVNELYRFSLSDILVLFFVLIVCVRIFSREYEKKLYPLLLATPSRIRVGGAKIVTMIFLTAVAVIAVYGGNLAISGAFLGLGDLSRPIQSLPDFRSCTLAISCWGYIGLGFAIKLFCAIAFGMLVFMLFTLFKKPTLVFFIVAAFLGISYWLYTGIPVTSSLNALHFINAFQLMDAFSVISRYQNVNLFTYPVSMTLLLPVALAIVFIVAAGVILFQFYTCGVCRHLRVPRWMAAAIDKACRIADRLNLHTSLFLHENRKVFSHGRALWILLALVLLMVSRYDAAFRFKTGEGEVYRQYIEEIGGKVTEDTLDFVENEWERIGKMESYAQENYSKALSDIELQLLLVQQAEEEKGVPAYLVDESGYSKLMRDTAADVEDALFIIAATILCCAGLFSMENTFGTKKLLRICRRGFQLPYDKLCITLLFSTLTAVIVEVTRFGMVIKDYPLLYADEAPVQSLREMMNFSGSMTLQQYLTLLFIVRLLGAWLVGTMVAVVSSCCRSDAVSIAVSFGVIAAPVIAVGAGVQPLQYISVLPFCGGNLLLQDTLVSQIWYGIFLIGCLILGRYLIKKQWRSQMPQKEKKKKPVPA